MGNVGRRKSSKGSGYRKTKGTGPQVPGTLVSILCCGRGPRRRPVFHGFSNMAPKSLIPASGKHGYRVTRDLREHTRKRYHILNLQVAPVFFRWQVLRMFTPIFSSLTPKLHPEFPGSQPYRPIPHATALRSLPDSHPPPWHNWNLAEVFFTQFLCAQANWFVSITRIGFCSSLSFLSAHSNWPCSLSTINTHWPAHSNASCSDTIASVLSPGPPQ